MDKQLRILIVDDNKMMAKTLEDIFRLKGYETDIAYSGRQALEKLKNQSFDCIISDIKMPEITGIDLYRAIKSEYPEMPVVLMTAYANDAQIEEGLAEGIIAVLTKPLDIKRLLNFLATLRQERSIMLVDDDPGFCRTLGGILQAHDFVTEVITDPSDIAERLTGQNQIVILDMKLKGTTGLDILRDIKRCYFDLPVILVTGHHCEMAEDLEEGLRMNAYAYLYKPLEISELLQILTQIHHRELGRVLEEIG